MKLESTQQRRPGDDSRQGPDELDQQRNKHRQESDSSTRPRLPEPPDPDNLPIEYPWQREIEWP
ncbi:hypothetical protein [Arthrobacter bambusae]|uniref:hypothetical protein n=1 Tax=Arthrobacter bambusae TaxID=1338426 RepID=UPI002787FE7D|nr:hypothetical protein [Arthrobacter bambusae]MDQ0030676.1 hypothetical protein [Arthrobacter bambusae]MDQ0099037.1 hypothetical protein [Arthrobacter bambusae]